MAAPIPPTVLDVSRSVAAMGAGFENFNSSGDAAVVDRVAKNLAYQFDHHHHQYRTTARDVRYALMAHGAHPMAVIRHAVWIARLIRTMPEGGGY